MDAEYERATDDGRETRRATKREQGVEGSIDTIRRNARGFQAAGFLNAAARSRQIADDLQARIDAGEFRRG